MKTNLFKIEVKHNSENMALELQTGATSIFTEMLAETEMEEEFMDAINEFSEVLEGIFDKIDEKLDDVVEEEK